MCLKTHYLAFILNHTNANKPLILYWKCMLT